MRLSTLGGRRPERLYQFLADELQPYPGRLNLMLRTLLGCALVIIISMTLQVPFLALSLIVVFYVTQTNVVLTRLVGMLFLVGATLAIGVSILLLKFTYGFPLLRILGASVLFFCSVYLMRVTKVGVVFFVVGIVVIYAQTFVDLTDQAEVVLRLVLWVWVAVSYAIALTLVVNTLLLPAEPAQQLENHLRTQLLTVANRLGSSQEGSDLDPARIQRSILASQQLLRFACMRDPRYRNRQAAQLARISSISRLLVLAAQLQPTSAATQVTERLRQAILDLAAAAGSGRAPAGLSALAQLDTDGLPGVYEEMRLALLSLQDVEEVANAAGRKDQASKLLTEDAFQSPVYAQFALKTLLAALLCYLFYMATDWQGIHTIMLTCLIVAQPSLGATGMRAVLRVGGALVGSACALAMVIWVVPHIDGIVGLLFMSLPVIALGAWIAAGSERISYAGIQIMFTFALALLEQFEPSTNLTEIRDRLIGVLLGVGISLVIHAGLWPEAEGASVRQRLARLVDLLAKSLRARRSPHEPSSDLRVWSELADCEAMLARVALEPSWQAAESQQETLVFRMQEMLVWIRSIAMTSDALHVEMVHHQLEEDVRSVALDLCSGAAAILGDYADQLKSGRYFSIASMELESLRIHATENINDKRLRADFLDLLGNIEKLPSSTSGSFFTPFPSM
ncbi:FUSC family protein [Pseudomonas sp. MPFS]|uniref:FUSC family protein n=1 Tax=Pseudomonas sp. MPFS TaxID=2795724 RepID=UPI001F133FEE|nr:FUSC family protein [Pseudomonas sp. MPFS]UMZ12086.1 FUSC family protein [Pseudomonas sp. MPFS]